MIILFWPVDVRINRFTSGRPIVMAAEGNRWETNSWLGQIDDKAPLSETKPALISLRIRARIRISLNFATDLRQPEPKQLPARAQATASQNSSNCQPELK
ncbi:hypothetical protein AYI69_g7726 [Smittium culicis]|nr:hypothetical protein AYI69_g7726 [Smittium culicis]